MLLLSSETTNSHYPKPIPRPRIFNGFTNPNCNTLLLLQSQYDIQETTNHVSDTRTNHHMKLFLCLQMDCFRSLQTLE